MELEVLIVNIAYATYAATALCQRLRTLRYVLLASSILFATFGLLAGIPSIIGLEPWSRPPQGSSPRGGTGAGARGAGPAPLHGPPTSTDQPGHCLD